MVTIFNKSNKPVGVIGGQFCLPDKKLVLKDKDVFVDVFDEDGEPTGEKKILPGLRAMEIRGYITIEHEEDKPKTAPKKKAVVEPVEEVKAEPKTTAKKTTTKRTTAKKTTEEKSE